MLTSPWHKKMFHIFITITSTYDEDNENTVLQHTQTGRCEHTNPECALHGRGSDSQNTSREHTWLYTSNTKQRVTQTYMPTFGEGFNHANFSGWESCSPNLDS